MMHLIAIAIPVIGMIIIQLIKKRICSKRRKDKTYCYKKYH